MANVITEDRASGAQIIDGSLKFDDGKSQYLSRTPGSAGNRKTFTISFWSKGFYTNLTRLFQTGTSLGTGNYFGLSYENGKLFLEDAGGFNLYTTALYRDTSAWYHIVYAIDTTQATSSDRVKVYVNGVRVTDFSTEEYPGQNTDTSHNNNVLHYIGAEAYSGPRRYLNNPITNWYNIDGQALDASYFGYTDGLTNTWRPKKYTGTFTGTNTFYLPFDGNSPIGEDKSGKGNNWTPVNFGGSVSLDKATGALPILNTNGGGTIASVGVRTDAYHANLVLALPLVGSKNDVSNSINSGSTTKTTSDSTTHNSFGNFYGGSATFANDAKNDAVDYSGDLTLGTGDFTLELWVFRVGDGSNTSFETIFDCRTTDNPSTGFAFGFNSSGEIRTYGVPSGTGAISRGSGANNGWNHLAIVRGGGTIRVYQNGIQKSSVAEGSTNYSQGGFRLGSANDSVTSGDWNLNARLQDVRLYKGVAKYTSNFIPASTSPDILPDTPSGVSSKSKLAKVTDGSVSGFETTSDYLSLAASSDFEFTGDHTIEMFIYHYTLSNDSVPYSTGVSGEPDQIYISSAGLINYAYSQTGVVSAPAGTAVIKKWQHIAVSKSGTNLRMFVDGKIVASSNNHSSTIGSSSNGPRIGARRDGYHPTQGFISNLRVIKGTALYTTDFTPPTSPLTNVTNTKLLCCQGTTPFKSGAYPIRNTTRDGSAITSGLRSDPYNSYLVFSLPMNGSNGGTTFTDQSDSSQSISVNGNTQTSTANSKYYGSSALFDGSGDSLTIGSTSDFAFGTGDYTIEMWVYHTDLTGQQTYFGDTYGSTSGIYTYKTSTNQLSLYDTDQRSASATNIIHLNTWHHLAWTRTSGVIREFVDGSCVSRDTPSTANYTVTQYYLGDTADQSSGEFFGYMQDVRVYKGVSKYTVNFIVTPPDVQPQADKIITSVGSVQTSTLSPFNTDINMERGDKSLFATWSPLESNTHTLSNGNLTASDDDNAWDSVVSTIGASTGKYYAEYTVDIKGWNVWGVDQLDPSKNGLIPASEHPGSGSGGFGWVFDPSDTRGDLSYNQFDGTGQNHYYNSGDALSSAVGDIISVAMDLDNNNVKFMKNGKIIFDIDNHLLSGYTYFFSYGSYQTAGTTANFGQKPFRYTPPEGFGPITGTSVRPETVIARPDQFAAASIWTGDGTENRLIPLNMKPDLIWIKQRNDTRVHILQDSVRGFTKGLYSNDTDTESTRDPGYGEAVFGGFEVSNGAGSNVSGRTMVAWNWKAGGNKNTFNVDDVGYASAAAAGLTGGTITPTGASVGTKQGFSILKYQGNGTAGANISHGLLEAPKLMIHKSLDQSRNWYTITTAVDGSPDYLYLNLTNQALDSAVTAPTDNLMYFTSSAESNNNTENYVVYMWHNVPGLQKFGKYTGNADANGPFIELGFRPAIVILKMCDTSTNSWVIYDNQRSPVNEMNKRLRADLSNEEDDHSGIDFLSNGFKLRNASSSSTNANNTGFIYAAWAEAPTFNLYGGQSNAR